MTEKKEAVRSLGESIGFGNMMSLASLCWREMLIEKYGTDSGAFTVGPCVGSSEAKELATKDARIAELEAELDRYKVCGCGDEVLPCWRCERDEDVADRKCLNETVQILRSKLEKSERTVARLFEERNYLAAERERLLPLAIEQEKRPTEVLVLKADEFDRFAASRQTVNEDLFRRAVTWLFSGDTGASSETMLRFALGFPPSRQFGQREPLDAGDLGRCIRLVEDIPEVREHFESIGREVPRFRPILENWDALLSMSPEEQGRWLRKQRGDG